MEDVDLDDTLAHNIEEELGVLGTLLGGDHIVEHGRASKLDVLVHKFERRERRDSTRSVSERNERSSPLQELKVLVEPGYGNQRTEQLRERKRTCPCQRRQTQRPHRLRSLSPTPSAPYPPWYKE